LGTAAEEAAYQLNVRLDAAVRNAFELAARRYGVSVSKIATLAPLLFVILAEASLRDQSKKVEQYWAKRDEFDAIDSQLPQLEESIVFVSRDDEVHDIEDSIAKNDVFGRRLWRTMPDDWDRDNPFATYLRALTSGREDITICAVGPKSTDYQVCRSEAERLAGEEFADWLLDGEVPIHLMLRALPKQAGIEDRIAWMREHKISVVKVEEETPIDVPEVPAIALDLDI
jgi:hypothetical protein